MAVFTEDVGHDLRVKLSKVRTEGMTEKELIALSIIDRASIRLILALLGGMLAISASIVANLIFK